MISLESLLPGILPSVPHCPRSMVLDAVQAVGIDFCKRTEQWRQVFTESVMAGQASVELVLPRDARLVRVLDIRLDGNTIAVELATKTAAEAANKAAISAKDAAQSLAGAEQAAECAENAQTAAEEARDVAEELAGKLLKDYHFELHAMELSTQLVRLADRITKVELDHIHGVSSGDFSMSPGGYEFAPGVTVAPLTISRVPMPVEGAALTAFVEPYNPPTSGTK